MWFNYFIFPPKKKAKRAKMFSSKPSGKHFSHKDAINPQTYISKDEYKYIQSHT